MSDNQYSREGWLNVPARSLEEDLQSSASMSAMYLRRTLEPPIFPKKLAENAQAFDTATLQYFANASAGDQTVSVDLGFDGKPLGFVWYCGAYDKDGDIVDNDMGILGKGDTYATLPTEVFGGKAGCVWDKDSLDIYIRSTNIGYSNFVVAVFKYVFFYDDIGVKDFGL